jgi:hypothetical protein
VPDSGGIGCRIDRNTHSIGVLLSSSRENTLHQVFPTKQKHSASQFKIFGSWPQATFHLLNNQSGEQWQITFLNLSGQKISSCKATIERNALSFLKPHLTPGIYTVTANAGNKKYKAPLHVIK